MSTLPRLLLALFVPAVLAAAPFEGKINLQLTSGGKPQEIVYQIKGDKIRLEMPGQAGVGGIIMDTAAKQTTVILDEEKMYMVMPMGDVASAAASQAGEDVKLEKTGQKEKILGYEAEKYLAIAKDGTTELWLAEGLGSFMSFNQSNPMMGGRRGGGSAAQGWEKALAGKELFPLRAVGKDKAGKESFRMEVKAVNKQSLSADLFSPPAGYRPLDMGGMMRGMMPGGARP